MSRTELGLLVDYGGVLTGPVAGSFAAWERAHGIEPGSAYDLLLTVSTGPDGGLIGGLERGEVTERRFDAELRALLTTAGYELPAGSILDGLVAGVVPDGALWGAVRFARASGIRTGLLSNSWGFAAYPRDRLDEHFDTLVISGEVGLCKPDPAIFHLACDRIGLPPDRCAFVDDGEPNVEVARELGMFAVLHDGDDAATVAQLERFFGIDLPVTTSGT